MMRSLPEGSGNNDDVGNAVTKVLSASLLVTSNTVGPSMFTLPEAVGGVGMMWGAVIFCGKLTILFSIMHLAQNETTVLILRTLSSDFRFLFF
jgi:hypothetical protein